MQNAFVFQVRPRRWATDILWRHIGARAVIGAGAVVITDVLLDVMAVGSPAKIIKHW